ncbi:hypothetical protein SPRG_09926 [Saprolegnia parasitica CBS 223.65]|uniref:Cation-transporting P-type ATPase N-terminal domain-containing protein n=1 Tax=Saprolegnia parasitica (strain CBS 223.65) TaxID=695850 RepID=A0A067C0J6_SAPPC|nr:hypothetical protein SPRG_09926 [Saprolegnia parasitica CBS 223.65]KDO24289.1 hypothetical protein SPRG_09926 [Saprolegnia parasitica CBS 223.65]|eukprot:XP_012205060.1 hypothetical protein SPRG_09926 [Saprolegnia parasitica CBS 223.65]
MTKVAPARSVLGITKDGLRNINVDQMMESNALADLGGIDGLAKKLCVNLDFGLSSNEASQGFADRRSAFGANLFQDTPSTSDLALVFETLKDTTILVLLAAAIASTITGSIEDPRRGWTEGVTIMIAVLLVGLVSATSNYAKEKQFRALSAKNDEFTSRCYDAVLVTDINVGDIIVLENGDRIPGDAVFVRGQDSRWGRIKSKLIRAERPTPLKDKLEDMVKIIRYGGIFVAVATMLVTILLLQCIKVSTQIWVNAIFVGWTDCIAFIIGVTIIVVAIPEGLPLAVTISLSYWTKKMLLDHNLRIRVLAACETMGNVTSICSDKTGTLTENRMTVVSLWVSHGAPLLDALEIGASFLDELSVNGALLLWLQSCKVAYASVRAAHFKPPGGHMFSFSSERKTMIIWRPNGTYRLFSKGAAGIVLERCSTMLTFQRTEVLLSPSTLHNFFMCCR